MILRKHDVPRMQPPEEQAAELGPATQRWLSEAGGLSQFGAAVETLAPGSRSSNRHWHEAEDELVYVLEGEATVIEDDGAHVIGPGDAAVWPAGKVNAHHVVNRGDVPLTYLVVGTRASRDVVHYPDLGRTTHIDGSDWRVVDDAGNVLRSGSD